jgi:glycosyltransferase involved in cell wall biosynthesis
VASTVLITFPHSLSSSGGGTVGCVRIAEHLARLGWEVRLAPVERHAGRPLIELTGQFAIHPVSPAPFHYLLDALRVRDEVGRLVTACRVQAVLGWDHEVAFLPQFLRSRGIAFGMIAARPSYRLWRDRQTRLQRLKRWSDTWFRWRPLRQADVVFALSQCTRRELVQLFTVRPERVAVAYWGVDSEFLAVPRRKPDALRCFLFFGSLAPLKGVFDALEALGRVARAGYHDWTLRIAGWGDEKAVLRAAQDHGIGTQVELLGRLDHQALREQLEWAELAILPSRAESFGLAIAEASAAGLPVVSYATGSIPEVVQDGVTGKLVPLGEIDCLARSVIELIEDPHLAHRMGLAGRQRVRELFSWERTARVIAETLETVRTQRLGSR